jgi:hypothetical protein
MCYAGRPCHRSPHECCGASNRDLYVTGDALATRDAYGVRFDLICNAQRRVSTRPSHAPASSRHVECTRSLKPIMLQPPRRGPTQNQEARPKGQNGGRPADQGHTAIHTIPPKRFNFIDLQRTWCVSTRPDYDTLEPTHHHSPSHVRSAPSPKTSPKPTGPTHPLAGAWGSFLPARTFGFGCSFHQAL